MSNIIIKVPSVFTVFLPADDHHPPGYINLGNVVSVDYKEAQHEATIEFVDGVSKSFTGIRAMTLWEAMGKTNGVNPEVEGEMA